MSKYVNFWCNMRIVIFILAISFSLINPAISHAVPRVFSYSATGFSNGDIVTIYGTDFGYVRSADYYQYFDDYTSDWSCNGPIPCSSNCNAFPSAGSGTNFTNVCVGDRITNHDFRYMGNYGYPLLDFSKSYSNFSTGRGFWQTIERHDHTSDENGVIGALPNSGLDVNIPLSSAAEFFAIYYVYWDPATVYNPSGLVIEKNVEIWSSCGKNVLRLYPYSGNTIRMDVMCDTGINEVSPNDSWHWSTGWHEVKVHMKKQSAPGLTDGVVRLWVDGNQTINDTNAKPIGDSCFWFNRGGGQTFQLGGNIQCGASGQYLCVAEGLEVVRAFDDVMINLNGTDPATGIFPAIATVYLSNNSTWGTGPTDKLNGDVNYVRQKVGGTADVDLGFKSWNNTQFKFQINVGNLDITKPIYLYITNWNGQTNPNGFRAPGR